MNTIKPLGEATASFWTPWDEFDQWIATTDGTVVTFQAMLFAEICERACAR